MDMEKRGLMNHKERYNQIIDEVYNDYVKTYGPNLDGKYISQPEFIFWVKTNDNFSKKCGLKIEEQELSLEERSIIASSNHNEVSQNIKMFAGIDEDHTLHKHLDDINIPTKLITITYNNETIESYE